MRRRVAAVLAAVALAGALAGAAAPVPAAEAEREFPALTGPGERLAVIGSTDLDALAPVIEAFQRRAPTVAVRYVQDGSNAVHRMIEGSGSGGFDLAISSAMDLQVKLANDGFARPHRSPATARLPAWARWRDRVLAFTLEPAVVVYDTRRFEDGEVPDTRFELVRFLRRQPEKFRGRIATYDPETSGLGYLFASQDSIRSSTWWRLTEIAGGLGVRLACCTGTMLDWIERGEVALAYNVLGSYALARKARGAPIGIILPADYTLTMARSALVPRDAPHPALAGRFVDFLLSDEGQRVLTLEAHLNGILARDADPQGIFSGFAGQLAPISFGPGLLVFLDHAKRRRFLTEWRSAVRRE